ncbi:pyridoxamine 5'-phosphate oxidase family protein [Spirillospora sp. NPDC047279]|uniref:pyridoxamine 5'-phosphate oxidase family protein n=1 Tax=Spirillospora sp. NPDC047279 TaxID=3155478 RepID=UPI003407A98E
MPGAVDEILGGDQAVMLASVTPARGVVLSPVTNFGLRDRVADTLTFNSSVGGWKKLERIRRDPRAALAFHTRAHRYADRPEYVLVQGAATVSVPIADDPESLGATWERFDGPRPTGPIWDRWLRVYYTRVLVEVAVERIIVWPDLTCSGTPEVYGPSLPGPPAPQPPPAKGAGPRLDQAKAARRAGEFPDVLLGWTGSDGLPLVVPVGVTGDNPDGLVLDVPPGLVPAGGRRAGLTAHSFRKHNLGQSRHILGQSRRIHTGWLANGAQARYAPHTEVAYRLPSARLAYRVGMGVAMRVALSRSRRAGVHVL